MCLRLVCHQRHHWLKMSIQNVANVSLLFKIKRQKAGGNQKSVLMMINSAFKECSVHTWIFFHCLQVLWRMWLGQITGYLTKKSLSATSAPKPSPRQCPSTTAGPVDRVCVAAAPHTTGLCPPEAGTTQSECVTAATPARIVFELCFITRWTSQSALGLPQLIHKKTLWVLPLLLQENVEDWSYSTKRQKWNQPWLGVKRQDVLKLKNGPHLGLVFYLISSAFFDQLIPQQLSGKAHCSPSAPVKLLYKQTGRNGKLDMWF